MTSWQDGEGKEMRTGEAEKRKKNKMVKDNRRRGRYKKQYSLSYFCLSFSFSVFPLFLHLSLSPSSPSVPSIFVSLFSLTIAFLVLPPSRSFSPLLSLSLSHLPLFFLIFFSLCASSSSPLSLLSSLHKQSLFLLTHIYQVATLCWTQC